MNIKHRPKSLRLSGLTDVCGKVSVYGQIEKDFTMLNRQTSHFFWARVMLYLLGSALVFFGKWPNKHK